MKVLVLNSGSSSVKYALFDMLTQTALIQGIVERIGDKQSVHQYDSPPCPKRFPFPIENLTT
ncbi:MAG: hypothetical protein H0A75_03940 [Candidatus Methanofishera endochildressiae]|uniref:Butyrate kinase n=1 Tax=Candidatus Methanofishera endochildressiae TaxID=2738884 RepID=A0A7Z0MP93_9GAMM|nr:hypothetical protein [Candidatus Methanofishera endochildressiae]